MPCHITQQYKFDLDRVWARDYVFVKLVQRSVRIFGCLRAFAPAAEEDAAPEPRGVRAKWASEAWPRSHPAGAQVLSEQTEQAESIVAGAALGVTLPWHCKFASRSPGNNGL